MRWLLLPRVVPSRALVDEKRDACVWEDAQQVRQEAFVEAVDPLQPDHVANRPSQRRVDVLCAVDLQARAKHLVGIGDDPCDHFRQGRHSDVLHVASVPLGMSACRSLFEPLIDHELDGAVRDAKHGGNQPAIPPSPSLFPRYPHDPVSESVVGGGR